MKKEFETKRGKYEAPGSITICQTPIDQKDPRRNGVTFTLNSNLKIVSVDKYMHSELDREIDKAFDCMWFSFPTPFKRGDIVFQPEYIWQPLVLDDICTWEQPSVAYIDRRKEPVQNLTEFGNFSDMTYKGYYFFRG